MSLKEQEESGASVRLIYFCTVVTICSLYAAQPIQPVFQKEFHLTHLQALLFTTLMMAPLGVAPLLYGFLLESYSAKKLLKITVLLLGLLELIFCATSNYFLLLSIRGIQGLLIPAVLTSMMSYIAFTTPREKVQQGIAFYIAATIVGGFLGRLLSGLLTELFGWRLFFFLLGGLFLVVFCMLGSLKGDIKMQYSKPTYVDIVTLLRNKSLIYLYCCIFCIFFTFSAMMNFLPFHLRNVVPDFGHAGTGFLYAGYSMGVLVSVGNKRIRSLFYHETAAVRMGIILFCIGTGLFLANNYWVMFFAMFVFCTGMFMAHSLLSGFVNTLSREKRALTNGLYISCYYTGGTLGSFLPGVLIEYGSWNLFLFFLQVVLVLAFFFNHLLFRSLGLEKINCRFR